MLSRLLIRNYAIIDELCIDYGNHLNIVTGETGAGKSIVMGALQLILGERADTSALRSDKKCVVEGVFTGGDPEAIKEFLNNCGLDISDEWILRREVTPNGKSRSFINDTPVNLTQLREMAALLVDLHQQFDTRELGNEDFQRRVLDSLCDNARWLAALSSAYDAFAGTQKKLRLLTEQKDRTEKELDYHRFLLDELESLALGDHELETLEAESKKLANADSIKKDIAFMQEGFEGNNDSLTRRLRLLQDRMVQVSHFIPESASLARRMEACLIELRDIHDEINNLDARVESDPARLDQINLRLSEGFRLLKKHGLQTTSQLLGLQKDLSKKIEQAENLSTDIESVGRELTALREQALEISAQISKNRHKQVGPFMKQVNALLKNVGMPHAAIRVELAAGELSRYGTDVLTFLFQANLSPKGDSLFLPLHKVASGGELSRLMLCIRSLSARSLQMPTMIFDEIDSGISGEAARQVGLLMKQLSENHQVIAITHQPGIAARANDHFFVYKEMKEGVIRTRVRKLDTESRIDAIARMIGGEKPSQAAIANAREMVENP